MTQHWKTTENELATGLVRTRSSHHCARPRLAVVDPVRIPVAGSTGHFRTRSECVRRGLGSRSRMRAFAKVAGSLRVARMRPSDRYRSRGCSGLQRIRSGYRRFRHEGWERPMTPGEPGFQFHHHIDHRIRLAAMGYIEGNRVLDDESMVDYMQA